MWAVPTRQFPSNRRVGIAHQFPAVTPMITKLLRQFPFLQKFQTNAQSQLMVQRLTRIIGPLPLAQQQAIQGLSKAQMTALSQAADDFSTPDDLADWLRSMGR
jgi:Domain of unknown function (DUF4351)